MRFELQDRVDEGPDDDEDPGCYGDGAGVEPHRGVLRAGNLRLVYGESDPIGVTRLA